MSWTCAILATVHQCRRHLQPVEYAQDKLLEVNVAERGSLELDVYVARLQALAQALQLGYDCELEQTAVVQNRVQELEAQLNVRIFTIQTI
jgi:hypothetical protein